MMEKALRYTVIAGIFALPFVCLLVSSSLFFPYITGKNFAFRVIVEILTGAWIALAIVNPMYRPRRSWILIALSLFVFIMLIADAFGAYAFKSLWSNYERMDGWITLAHLLAYTVVAASTLTSESLWRRLFWTSLSVSAYVSVYGLLQVAGKLALGLGGTTGLAGRIDATFGNPIYLAVYMLFHIFIAAMLWAQQWVENGPGKRLYISIAYGSVIALDTLALLLSGTRGTILGLLGGAFLSTLLMLFFARNSRNVWRASVAGVVGILILTGSFMLVRHQPWVQSIGFLQRMASISLSDQTAQSRLVNWSIAWEGVKERPILGWGQENYALVFDRYYDPRMYLQEPWFDRVHNIIFDWLVAGGFLGLITYLGIFAATMFVLWRPRTGGAQAFTIAERSLLTGLLAGYSIHNFFVFDNVTSYILFGSILAFVSYRESKAEQSPVLFEAKKIHASHFIYVVLATTVVLALVLWNVNQRPIAANKLILRALSEQQDPLKNLSYYQSAIALGTFGTQEAREQLAQVTTQLAGISGISNDIKQKFFDTATSEMTLQAEMSPLDARPPLFKGITFAAYGDYENARIALETAHELSLKKQTILFELGQNAFLRGDAESAIAYLKEAYELEKSSKESALVYAAGLIRTNRSAEADVILEPYVQTGEAADQRILSAYESAKQLPKAIAIWEASIQANPKDGQPYFTLAALYYTVGNTIRAIATLELAKKNIPDMSAQVDSIIEQIRNGTIVVS